MSASPISAIAPIPIPQTIAAPGAAGEPGEFGSILSNTINTLEGMNNNASESVQNFLTGQNEDLHTTILATQKASLAFELGMQVRNKVVDAYQEVMKMQL
jgi:flagellar hook-basal body complex protein FliE